MLYIQRCCTNVVAVFTLLMLAAIIYHYPYLTKVSVTDLNIHDNKTTKYDTQEQILLSKTPLFAFMIQTGECLPGYLHTDEYFGNHVSCNCHVYVLSYKKPCMEKLSRNLSHITHFYKTGTLWSSGRNTAYFAAKKNGHPYLYYIFMDDDILLQYNELTPQKYRDGKTPPLQIFTEFLLRYQPAVAAPEYSHWNHLKDVIEVWHNVCKVSQMPDFLPLWHHDAAFEAFHRNTIDILLPYEEKFDKALYFLAAVVTTFRITVAFYGQHMYFPYIKAVNPLLHRYRQNGNIHPPGHLLCDRRIRTEMVEDIRKWLPSQYRNHPVLELIQSFPIMKQVHTQCVDPPVQHSPIIPYKHMYNKTESSIYPLGKDRCNW